MRISDWSSDVCSSDLWDSAERPGGSFHLSREPIDHIRQKTNMVCWAAAGTMLCSARDRMCAPVEVIMTRADSNDPGYGYLTMYQGNKGLPPGDTGRRSEEHTSELQSLMRISYAVFCLKKTKNSPTRT